MRNHLEGLAIQVEVESVLEVGQRVEMVEQEGRALFPAGEEIEKQLEAEQVVPQEWQGIL